MKNSKGFAPVAIVLIIVAVLALGGITYYAGTQNNTSRLPDSNVVPHGNLIGGDKDAHGCIGSAGYTWCEVKNKCLRVWEEKCEVTPIAAENMIVKVYFGTPNSQQLMCNDVTAVERVISKTTSVGTRALEELFKGPTAEEKNKGYFTSIPVGSKLNSLVVVNGEARADFNSVTESGGGSCSMAMRGTQIGQTLLQFPTIKTVLISIDGRTKDIFQP